MEPITERKIGEVKYDIVEVTQERKIKKKKFTRSHAETIRTCVSVLQLLIGCLTLLRVFGKI